MSRMVRSGAPLLLAIVLGGCAAAPERPAAPPSGARAPQEPAAGWVSLFDGRTLEGWEDPARESPPGDAWTVEDGCIKSVHQPRFREDLYTRRTFSDFELAWEWRISAGGNSGVKYRIQDRALLVKGKNNGGAKRFEDKVDYELTHRLGDRSGVGPGDEFEEYAVAFEYQLIDDAAHPDARKGPDRSAGAIYSMVAPTEQAARPAGEWNEARIVLRGSHVEHWLNGRKVIDTSLDSEPIRAGLEKRWGVQSPVFRLLTGQPRRETPIALQHHNDVAWFRDIRIRRL